MRSLYVYPWDLQDEKPATVIDNAKKMGKIDTLSIASIYHTGRFLLPHNPKRKLYIPEDGVVYFKPRKENYTGCMPPTSRLTEHDTLAESLKLLKEEGMKSRSWVVCLHNSLLGTKNRDWTIQTVFGDYNTTSLCPSNPEVITYFREVLSDFLEQYQFDWVELESFEYAKYQHRYHHEKIGIPLDALDLFLLSLCFCVHCQDKMKTYGVDLRKIRQQVREQLEVRFNDPKLRTEEEIKMGLAAFKEENRSFIEARQQIVSNFVNKLTETIKGVSATKVLLLYRYDYDQAWLSGIDLDKLTSMIDGWLVQGYFEQREKFEKRLVPFLKSYPKQHLEVGLNGCFPFVKDKKDIMKILAVLTDLGVENFSFYNYGFMPLRNLQWIGEALAICDK